MNAYIRMQYILQFLLDLYLNNNNNSSIIEGQLNAKVTCWVFLKKSKHLNEEIIIKLHIKCSIYARNV